MTDLDAEELFLRGELCPACDLPLWRCRACGRIRCDSNIAVAKGNLPDTAVPRQGLIVSASFLHCKGNSDCQEKAQKEADEILARFMKTWQQ